jgi:hypothetical protein
MDFLSYIRTTPTLLSDAIISRINYFKKLGRTSIDAQHMASFKALKDWSVTSDH